jgi:DnaJ-domain-containing protein 1
LSADPEASCVFPPVPVPVTALPPWLLAGLALGALASAVVAGVFVVGGRLFPDAPRQERPGARDDGSERRRAEIRAYLRAIDERFVEDRELVGRRVAFYLPERDVAITFDPKLYFRLDSAGHHAVLCEHELPGWALGRRLPFETPAVGGPDAVAEVDAPVADAFAELGLAPDATADEVRTAYRERVKEVHPDQGGDRELFKRVRAAYATARSHAD